MDIYEISVPEPPKTGPLFDRLGFEWNPMADGRWMDNNGQVTEWVVLLTALGPLTSEKGN